MKKITLIFVLFGLMVSCKKRVAIPVGNDFYFETPQPINDSELSSIPNKFQGIYINTDSVYVNIKKDIVYTEYKTKFRFHKNQIDSLNQYFNKVKDGYKSVLNNEVYYSKVIGDSIELTSTDRDTVFMFSDFQRAKRINGNLVLSQKDSIYWKVKLLILNKNKLIIKGLYSDSDLIKMDSITKVNSRRIDSTAFLIMPKRKEFNEFFQLKNFGYDQEYNRISK
jgi:hypothetical protein